MNINLENLYYMVEEHLDNTHNYHKVRLECWERQNGGMRKFGVTPKTCSLYVDHLEGEDALKFAKAYERSECGERAISDFCTVLNIDQSKLFHMVKTIRKWHERKNWQACFPFTETNSKAILSYLQA